MKKFIGITSSKFIFSKRALLINSLFFIVIMLFLPLACTEKEPAPRLVFPVLTTVSASAVTITTAVSGGNITSEGGSQVTARGVCWSTTANPSIAFAPDSMTVDGTGLGEFTSNITGLDTSVMYHVRAYATNPDGTSYGQDISFTTAAAVK